MKNYVVRWTVNQYGRRVGEYATQGMGYGARGSTPNIDDAYVFNTRMNRRGAMHNNTQLELEKRGAEVVFVSLIERP